MIFTNFKGNRSQKLPLFICLSKYAAFNSYSHVTAKIRILKNSKLNIQNCSCSFRCVWCMLYITVKVNIN